MLSLSALFCDDKVRALVRLLPCYPSANARLNRDREQWWRTQALDGTLRPYQNPSLCVTNSEYKNTSALPHTLGLVNHGSLTSLQ